MAAFGTVVSATIPASTTVGPEVFIAGSVLAGEVELFDFGSGGGGGEPFVPRQFINEGGVAVPIG